MGEMHDQSDAQLLSAYAERGTEAAFAEIVARHTDLVYSAALRQVYSPDLARDVTQSVFTDLARKARDISFKLSPEASLVGWLYRGTRFAARDLYRNETRRTQRERQAMEQLQPTSETPPDWEQLRPALDDAMAELDDTDRDAVLLRYFKNHDLRTVGATLGISNDAAQKRVSRAVERLRECFAKRGVTVGASGLAVVISANAVQAAPVGLALTISTAAVLTGTTLATTATATATKALAMTTLQKTIVTATIAALAGVGIYEARQASQLRGQVQTLQQQQAPLLEQIQQLQGESDDTTRRLAVLRDELAKTESNKRELLKLRSEVARLQRQATDFSRSSAAASASPALPAKLERANHLRQQLDQFAKWKIPELQLLTDGDWLNALGEEDPKTQDGLRLAFAGLRYNAKLKLVPLLQAALKEYVRAHEGQLPATVTDLKPYFASPVNDTILERYTMAHTGPLKDVPEQQRSSSLISEKAGVDEDIDVIFTIGINGQTTRGANPFFATEVPDALKAYKAEHNGQMPSQPSELAPYFRRPPAPGLLERAFNVATSH